MKRVHSLALLIVLVIAPMFPVFMVPTTNENSIVLSEDIPEKLIDVSNPDNIPQGDVELTQLFFTETPSSEDGLYYVCRSGINSVAYFGASKVMYISGGVVFTHEFVGSNSVIPQGENPTGSITNYMYGNDPSKWKTGIEDYSKIRYNEIYQGIDLVYYLLEGNLKYEFRIAPFTNPHQIHMRYSDIEKMSVEPDQIIVSKSGTSFTDTGLYVFQENNDVPCSYRALDQNSIGFQIGDYDESQELIVDPLLVYSTLIGGSNTEKCHGTAVEDGYTYLTGETQSSNFPTFNAYNSTHSGETFTDCFVLKLSKDGQSLLYSTFFGGDRIDAAFAIAVESGFAYVTGETGSNNFPMAN